MTDDELDKLAAELIEKNRREEREENARFEAEQAELARRWKHQLARKAQAEER